MLRELRQNMAKGKIPFEASMLSLAMLLVNIPSLVFGTLFFWVILPIPGLILYGFVVAMALGKLSPDASRLTAILSILYQTLLLIILISIGPDPSGNEFLSFSFLLSIPLATIGFAAIMLRVLNESDTNTHESA